MSSSPCGCSRRHALKLGATSAVALSAGVGPGCGGAQDTLAAPVTLTIADFPELATDGGIAVVATSKTGHEHPLIVQNEGGVYTALSSECNHAGCSVNLAGAQFKCPCHGSAFALDGALIKGPATLPLLALTVTPSSDGTAITISN